MMKAPNIQNIQGNGRSRRWRVNSTRMMGMATYAAQMKASETLWSQTSSVVHPPQYRRAMKSDESNSLLKNSMVILVRGSKIHPMWQTYVMNHIRTHTSAWNHQVLGTAFSRLKPVLQHLLQIGAR